MRVERAKGESLETAMPAWWVVLRGGGVRERGVEVSRGGERAKRTIRC